MLLNALSQGLNLALLSAALSIFTSLGSNVKAEYPKLTFYHNHLILFGCSPQPKLTTQSS